MENENEFELRRENNKPEEEESGVSFSDIWHMIIKHWVALIVSIMVCALAGGIYGKAIKKPVWQATAQAFVVTQVSDTGTTNPENVNQSDYQYAVTLIPSVVAFMNSNVVLNDVTEKLNTQLNKDYDMVTIKKMVAASSDNYSTASLRSVYITINAKSSSPEFSIALANQFLDSAITIANTSETNPYFKNKILESSRPSKIETSNGKIVYDAVVDSSMSTKKIVLIAAAIGLVIGIAYGIIFELCNTHVISNKEIEQLTGVKVIGTIPDLDPKTEEKIRKNSKKSGGHM